MLLNLPVTTVGDALSVPTPRASWRKSLKALFKARDKVSQITFIAHACD